MIQITIEQITVVKNDLQLHDMATGETKLTDSWERRTLYMQTFTDGEEPDIKKVVRTANKEVAQ